MKQGVTRRGKPHCEAFPSIDILDARRSLRSGSDRCEWRDERGQLVGHGRLLALAASRMALSYDFCGSANIDPAAGTLNVAVSGTRRNPNVVRLNLHCPTCERRVQALFYVSGSWACKICHGLVHLTQRLSPVNKLLFDLRKMQHDLEMATEEQRRTRSYLNQRRHVERLERDMAAHGIISLPEELSFRTYQRWLAPNEVAAEMEREVGVDGRARQRRGLAYFQPPSTGSGKILPCEAVGSRILYRPALPFLKQRLEEMLVAVLDEIAKGTLVLPRVTMPAVASVLCERAMLRPLVITGPWSEMDETYTYEDRAESSVTACYEGDPTLWPVGPDAEVPQAYSRAVLDARDVTLRMRLPAQGRSDARADLDRAAAELQAQLSEVRAVLDVFNASLPKTALRCVRRKFRAAR